MTASVTAFPGHAGRCWSLARWRSLARIVDMTALLPHRVLAHGERVAIVDPAGEWTFAGIDDDATRLAGALKVGHGDRVAILCACPVTTS